MTVAHILSRKGRAVETVQPHTTLHQVVGVLAAKHVGALVVADDSGALKGIVSERDVVRAIAANGVSALEDAVSRYMTKTVVTANEAESVIDVVRAMSSGRFRHMPIMNGDRLVGIVSVGDAIKYRLEQMEAEQSALREYIATA